MSLSWYAHPDRGIERFCDARNPQNTAIIAHPKHGDPICQPRGTLVGLVVKELSLGWTRNS